MGPSSGSRPESAVGLDCSSNVTGYGAAVVGSNLIYVAMYTTIGVAMFHMVLIKVPDVLFILRVCTISWGSSC